MEVVFFILGWLLGMLSVAVGVYVVELRNAEDNG